MGNFTDEVNMTKKSPMHPNKVWLENPSGEMWQKDTIHEAVRFWRQHFSHNKLPYKIHANGQIYSARRLWRQMFK